MKETRKHLILATIIITTLIVAYAYTAPYQTGYTNERPARTWGFE